MIIQIIGLPGAGKTELAKGLCAKIKAIHLNADEIRKTVNSDLGFSNDDRIEQSRRLGEMARLLERQGHNVIVDSVCPTNETRDAFGKPDLLIWVDRIEKSRFDDTNTLWQNPIDYVDFIIKDGLTIEQEVGYVMSTYGL
jgi:cytidylate kinase